MSDEFIVGKEDLPVSVEVRELVDKFIDGRLSEEENVRLEAILESDEQSLGYCAERMRFHAEVEELMAPVRVELLQKRHLVVETKSGLATVSKAVSNVVRVGSPKFDSPLELPPGLKSPKQIFAYGLATLAIVVVILTVVFYIIRNDESSTHSAKLELRNASFEALPIDKDNPPYIYTILDWQDYFQTNKVMVCDVERATSGQKMARDGKYAVLMKAGGFLTQRLAFNDGETLTAKKGLRLKISGWAMPESSESAAGLWISSRVVVSAYPSMAQVKPDEQKVEIDSETWEKFEVILSLPSDSLMMAPSISDRRNSTKGVVDITGLDLAISIDNMSDNPLYLDHLSIGVLPDVEGAVTGE
ncbi:hypothetical protein ACFPK9_01805 [Rubritalea spongiae]|uniref:Zinc-finger domain-containing protein n=1 Tax=Rubritalea spongiae TaxID=430797 RepID=A0ABW5E393_9BACT